MNGMSKHLRHTVRHLFMDYQRYKPKCCNTLPSATKTQQRLQLNRVQERWLLR